MNEKILIVDDEEGIRQDLSFILEDEGYVTTMASRGSEALALINEKAFDIVITDLMMPDMDGMEILRQVKRDYPDTIVFMITGHGSEEKAVEAMKSGAQDYLPKPFDPDEMLIKLRKSLEMMRLKLENELFHRHLEMELEVARKIQKTLLAQKLPAIPGIDISTFNEPARQVGGDYVDLIELSPEKLGIAIGDVSGKGMPAALLMANVQASLRRYSESGYSPRDIITRINNSLCPICQHIEEHRFITLFYGVLNSSNGTLTYSNAGHNYPFIFRGNMIVEELESTGVPCGIVQDYDYDEAQTKLKPKDIALFYTDGVTEATNWEEIPFGETRLKDLLLEKYKSDSSSLLMDIYHELEKFIGNTPQYDDLTLMVLKMQ